MHLLDEEELAHVGKVLRKGYVRVHRPKKRRRVKDILFCVFYSLLALLFLALSVFCVYCVVQGLYLFVTFPGFIFSTALFGILLREIHLSFDRNTPPLLRRKKRSHVKSPPNFLPDPDAQAHSPSHQSSVVSFESEEATSTFQSASAEDVVKYSKFDESVQIGKNPKMIRSVSQYEEDNVSNQDEVIAETVAQSSFSSSRKRVCHNFESEESLVEMEASPFVESSILPDTKEIDKISEKGSSQSLPAMKFMSNSDT